MGEVATVTIPLVSYYDLVVGKLKYESLIGEMIREKFPNLENSVLFDYSDMDSELYQQFCRLYGGEDPNH